MATWAAEPVRRRNRIRCKSTTERCETRPRAASRELVTNQACSMWPIKRPLHATICAAMPANDVDVLANNLEASRKQQRGLYAISFGVWKILGRAAAPAPGWRTGSGRRGPWRRRWGSPAPGSDDKAAVQTAFNLLKDSQSDPPSRVSEFLIV